MYKIILLLISLFVMSSNALDSKYCGYILGNPINISVYNNTANISADIFAIKIRCNNEPFILDNTRINVSDSPKDCLNQKLHQYDITPCPPIIVYENKNLIVTSTPIGNITLTPCH